MGVLDPILAYPLRFNSHRRNNFFFFMIALNLFRDLANFCCNLGASLGGAVVFYTCIPLPSSWALDFRGIARWAPLIGVLIGGILAGWDSLLQVSGMPILTRSALVILAGIALTGGLHLDGVMDSGDGLGVQDPQRRLLVMADSVTGAMGAIAGICLVVLKICALSDLPDDRVLGLMLAGGWGRWGQLICIVRYPYLKATGKGAFHQDFDYKWWDFLGGALLLLGLTGLLVLLRADRVFLALGMAISGVAIAFLTGLWFHWRFGGHTGDTLGAVVEWTEALFLCLFVTLH